MYITNKHISRRTILRGMGAAVSLPFARSHGAGPERVWQADS